MGQAVPRAGDARMDGLCSRAGEGAGDRSCWLLRLQCNSYARLYRVVKRCEIMKTPAETTGQGSSDRVPLR